MLGDTDDILLFNADVNVIVGQTAGGDVVFIVILDPAGFGMPDVGFPTIIPSIIAPITPC